MGRDVDAVLAVLLHDCIEDTDTSHEEIEKVFGATVAELVEGVTKLTVPISPAPSRPRWKTCARCSWP